MNFEKVLLLDAGRRDALVAALNAVCKKGAISADGLLALSEFAGNSVAGAARLLQYLAPGAFPAWDGRAAKAWLKRSLRERMHEQVPMYLEYRDALQGWSRDPGVQHSLLELRGLAPALSSVSMLRLMELPLHHAEARPVKAD